MSLEQSLKLLVDEYVQRNVLGEFVISKNEIDLLVSHVKTGMYSGDYYFIIQECVHCSSHGFVALHVSICSESDLDLVIREEGLLYHLDLDGVLYEH